MSVALTKRMAPAALIVALVVAGCQNGGGQSGFGPKTGIGAAAGAAGGGLLGAALGGGALGIASGVLLGGLAGGAVGSSMDNADRRMAAQASQRALEQQPTGQASTWRNPDSGNSGTVTPTRTYQAANGNYCREYQQTIVVAGKPQQSYGTACRQADGSWKVVN